jgi:hypothetical protein
MKSPSKYLYNKLIDKLKCTTKKHEIKWNNEIPNLDWRYIYQMPFLSTIDAKLRSFQIKFTNRIIPTNKLLFKQKIVNSTLCDFCCRDTETIKHMYYDCQHVQNLWTWIHTWLNEKEVEFNLNFQTACFGVQKKSRNDSLINMIILLAKYYIFKCKMENSIPKPDFFLMYVKERKMIEECIAETKNKMNKHNQKWGALNI